ncbi:MAG TPA: cytochrome c [Panacibacter sp.]|nr:cytochrome c [Panacibacter sp.]
MKKILFLAAFTFPAAFAFAYTGSEGKTIFTTRCAACHAIDKKVVGPALMNVEQRRDEQWIIAFVHSSQTVIKSGDSLAVNLYKEFNSTPMPDHADLTDEQVKSIISYIKEESKTIAAAPKVSIERPQELQPHYKPVPLTNYTFWAGLFLSISLLAGVLLFRVKIESFK